MISLKEVDTPMDLSNKITEGLSVSITSLEGEIKQLTEILVKKGTLLELTELNCLEKENLIRYMNSDLF